MKLRLLSIILLGMFVISIHFCGCSSEIEQVKTPKGPLLPPEIPGTWKAERTPWTIVLEEDGTVSSVIIAMAAVGLKPNQVTKVKMRDDKYSTFTAGDFLVEYNEAIRELTVEINVVDIHVAYLDNIVEGNSKNIFVGTVSEDGETWDTTFFEVFDYGPRFPMDPNALGNPLIFKKVHESTLEDQ